jgi:hypothetical protein
MQTGQSRSRSLRKALSLYWRILPRFDTKFSHCVLQKRGRTASRAVFARADALYWGLWTTDRSSKPPPFHCQNPLDGILSGSRARRTGRSARSLSSRLPRRRNKRPSSPSSERTPRLLVSRPQCLETDPFSDAADSQRRRRHAQCSPKQSFWKESFRAAQQSRGISLNPAPSMTWNGDL